MVSTTNKHIQGTKESGENTPFGRPGRPVEVAPAYVFLASEEANYISGATLPVTGGRITI